MFELFKVVWDIIVLRDEAQKGRRTNWRIWVYGAGFVLLLYVIALPAVVLYEKHPQYKPLFVAAMVLDGVLFVAFMSWAIVWRKKQLSVCPNNHAAQD